MGRTASQVIDFVIEKKLDSQNLINSDLRSFYNYSKIASAKNQEFQKYCFEYGNLLNSGQNATKVDVYNNKFYNFYENKVKKTQCKFNLLRLFKPGELLTSVAQVTG